MSPASDGGAEEGAECLSGDASETFDVSEKALSVFDLIKVSSETGRFLRVTEAADGCEFCSDACVCV